MILFAAGLIVSEVSILPSVKKSDLFGISVAWAWGYLALIWGASFIVLLIPGLSRSLWVVNNYFRKACRFAIAQRDFSYRNVLAQLLVSSLLNFLVLSIVFLPALAASIIPAIAIIRVPYCDFLNNYLYSLFLWLFAGIAGPALIYAVRHYRDRKLFPKVGQVISMIQRTCYLAILIASLVITSGFLDIHLLECGKSIFFFHQYLGAVIPSTLAGLAVINYFESKTVKSQSKAVLGLAVLLVLSNLLIFFQIFSVVLVIFIVSIVIWIAVIFYEKFGLTHRRK